MRIAQRLRTEHLYPLTAGLLETVSYLETIKSDFADLREADHAFLVMAEWRKLIRNERGDTSAAAMVKLLKDANINIHVVCQVHGDINASKSDISRKRT